MDSKEPSRSLYSLGKEVELISVNSCHILIVNFNIDPSCMTNDFFDCAFRGERKHIAAVHVDKNVNIHRIELFVSLIATTSSDVK